MRTIKSFIPNNWLFRLLRRVIGWWSLARIIGILAVVTGLAYYNGSISYPAVPGLEKMLSDIAPELMGIGLTLILIDWAIERRGRKERKAQLIKQMGSRYRDITEMAIIELRHNGWLEDGSLRRADLRGANLHNADLRRANLFRADLSEANLRSADLRGAKLVLVNVYDAKLGGANIQGAKLGTKPGAYLYQLIREDTTREEDERLEEERERWERWEQFEKEREEEREKVEYWWGQFDKEREQEREEERRQEERHKQFMKDRKRWERRAQFLKERKQRKQG